MVAKVKYPVRAALARFGPIRDHLENMDIYLTQAGIDFGEHLQIILQTLTGLELRIKKAKAEAGLK
jgi:hypothetical protein